MGLFDRRTFFVAATVATVVLGGAVVWAQSSDDGVVLHEYFNPWDVDLSGTSSGAKSEASGVKPADNHAKAVAGDPPGLSVNPGSDEVIFGANGPVDPGRTSTPYGPLDPEHHSSRLDDATDRVDQLDYYANFEPSIVPYKRGVVQNKVQYADGDYSLTLQTHGFSRVRVEGGDPRADEDVFWGSFLLRATSGKRHPLPSVAPSQRILDIQTEPEVAVKVVRDDADNFYVIPRYDGLLRLNMRIAAPRKYFGGALAEDVQWSDFRERTPALPRPVRAVADRVLQSLSISKTMRPIDALNALVEHYRNFEGRPFPDKLRGKDLYASISRAQIGVCRHRSLAFVISARALGIPARYVYNEAHAFVEIDWPGRGWRRIDLGGAANQMNYTGRAGGTVHKTGPDSLPEPPKFKAEQERIRQRGGASSADQSQSAQASPGESSSAPADGSASGQRPGPAADGPADGATADAPTPPGAPNGANPSTPQAAHAADEPPAQASSDQRTPVHIDVQADTSELFRGNALGLRGSVFSERGEPVADKNLQVYLGPVGGHSADGFIPLGSLHTDSRGRFHGKLAIPEKVAIGRWSVVVRFAGDEHLQPAQVE